MGQEGRRSTVLRPHFLDFHVSENLPMLFVQRCSLLTLCYRFAWICVGVGSHGIGISLPSVIHSLGMSVYQLFRFLS